MAATPLVVGVDLGTTSAKAVAYDRAAAVWGTHGVEYPLNSPRPGWAEQDPDVVLDGVCEAIAGTTAQVRDRGGRVAGVCLSAAMHSLVALGDDGEPLTPALTFADGRATPQARHLRDAAGGLEVYLRTGTPIHPMSPLTKLLWYREEDPDTFSAAARWVSLKEHLLRRLLAADVVDESVASASGLYNLRERDWDTGALELAKIRRDQLSRLVPTDAVLRGLRPDTADRLGLDPGTPWVVGAADGCLANLGVGAVTPGVAAVTIGTSGAVRVAAGDPSTDPKGRLFTYVLTEDRWIVGGPINNGGIVLRWLRDELMPDVAAEARRSGRDPYDRLTTMAADVPPGADGLLFLPYLTGERAPHWNAATRGVLFGLQFRHSRPHVVRATLEGVLLQLRLVVEALEELGITPHQFRASGGFTDSALWVQMMADVFRRDIAVPERAEGTCLGAALLGMAATGLADSLEDAAEAIRIDAVRSPDAASAKVYDQLSELFSSLYERVEDAFDELASIGAEPTAS